jgi:hypothetical protein
VDTKPTGSARERPEEALIVARRTLRRIATIALATASRDAQPWNTPVYAAFDGRAFYWSSLADAVHSVNIGVNPAVFLAIFDSTAPDQSGRGLYVSATARELVERQSIAMALDVLAARKGESPKRVEDHVAPYPQRVYEAVPDSIWINVLHEDRGCYFDERVQIDIGDLQRAVPIPCAGRSASH